MKFTKRRTLHIAAVLMLASACAQAQDAPRPAPGLALRPAGTLPDAVEVPVTQLCARARSGDSEALNQLAWAYAYGKGTERNDAFASYLFYAAATQGHDGARRMLRSMSWPAAEIPPCLTEVDPPPAPPAEPRAEPPAHIDKIVRSLAPKYELDPQLVLAVIEVESNFNPFALSPKNAMGLMQLIPETSQRFGVSKPFDARDNVQGGMAYLRWLLAYFEGNVTFVAAAYNAGEGAVEKYKGVPPYAETQDYVRKVLGRFGATQHPFNAKVVGPSQAMRQPAKVVSSATGSAARSAPAADARQRSQAARSSRAISKVADARKIQSER